MTNHTTILCLDLAFSNTGCAVLALDPAAQVDQLIHTETIHTDKTDKETLRKLKMRVSEDDWRRSQELYRGIDKVISRFDPVHIFIECPTGGSKSAFAAKAMALAKGIACAATTQHAVPVTLITPFEAKRAATGSPDATKGQVKKAAMKLFPDYQGWAKTSTDRLLVGANEHVFDAISVYMAAKKTKAYGELKNVGN